MMTPLRKPMVSISSRMTITMDSIRLTMKVLMELPTISGWKNTLWNSMPAGTDSALISSSRASTSLPILMMSVPDSAEMSRPMAGCPSYFMELRTGVCQP